MSYCKVNFRFYFLSNPTTLPLPRSFCYAPTLPTAILLVNLQSIRKRSKKCVVQSFVFLPIPALLPLPLPPPSPPKREEELNFRFFSRTSQGHNALPGPGLEPGSSDSEPSALTTGLLNKAVALARPRYS